MPEIELPYFKLLFKALEEAGCHVWPSNRFPRRGILFGKKWDAIHFHMLNFIFIQKSGLDAIKSIAFFFFVLLPAIKIRRIPIIWTCHEFVPHEGSVWKKRVIKSLSRWFCNNSNYVVVHNSEMKALLHAIQPRREKHFVLIPHGDLRPYYTKYIRYHNLNELESKVFTMASIGYMRHNKGNDIILQAFRRLPNPDARLIMVGNCPNIEYRLELENLAKDDERIELNIEAMTDETLVWHHDRADVVVFGFRDCPTSGSVTTALSLGKAVIAPRIGHVIDLIDETNGWTYDVREAESNLLNAMAAASNDRKEYIRRGEAAQLRMAVDRWADIASSLKTIYLKRNY